MKPEDNSDDASEQTHDQKTEETDVDSDKQNFTGRDNQAEEAEDDRNQQHTVC